jgi:tRNA-2-methylthio-N6-dimethylallyladenosine synthase
VQSGSDRVLEAMNRRHDRAFYLDLADRLKAARPDLALSSDFIVGFPGETDADFEDTLDLVRRVGFVQTYSFKYSARPGTPAAAYETQVPEAVREERLARLQGLLDEQTKAFNRSMVGRVMPVLLDRLGRHDGQLAGRSPYMQPVHVENAAAYLGRVVPVRITRVHPNSLAGTVLEPDGGPMR